MADITGQVKREIFISPDEKKMRSLAITGEEITQAVRANNVNIGSILVKDGKYLYNLEFSSYLKNLADVQNIYVKPATGYCR
jgi:multidrug efflux pump subunit AcrB